MGRHFDRKCSLEQSALLIRVPSEGFPKREERLSQLRVVRAIPRSSAIFRQISFCDQRSKAADSHDVF